MALRVVSFCGYLCNLSICWRTGASGDYDAHDFVLALKGEHFKGYGQIPVLGSLRTLRNENAADAIQWFGEMAAAYLNEKKVKGPFVVIPVPNSSSIVDSTTKPRTKRLGKALVDHLADKRNLVLDCLRFKQNLGSARSQGGPRDPALIYKNLVSVRKDITEFHKKVEDAEEYKVILVDDVTTSGGHLRACAARLKKDGFEVELVICGGKTVYDQDHAAFDIREEKLEQYEP